MYIATDRVARLCGKLLVRQAALHGRTVMGILLLSGALLFMPNTAHAQSELRPGSTPIETTPALIVSRELSLAETPSAEIIHVIEVGDNLTNVASRYNVETGALAAYNQILDFNHVMLGQKLRIPPVEVATANLLLEDEIVAEATGAEAVVAETSVPEKAVVEVLLPGFDGYHVVRKGESLSVIARLYDLSLDELMELNEITNANLVHMGRMLRLTDEVEPPTQAIKAELDVVIYEVKRGDTLSEIAKAHHTTVVQLVQDNNLADESVYVGQELRILPPSDAAEAFGVDAPVDGERRIVIDLSDQTLTAYQGDVVVLHSIVSTGKAATPTPTGEYAIYLKYQSQHMTGDDYDLPGVPWVMYYYDEYAIHGAYWHANFGIPTSHGCTNMTIADAKALYSWAPEGTPVSVQW